MKPKFRRASSLASFLAVVACTCSAARATTYFWDNNDTTAGFGIALGTWPTDAFWTTDGTGAFGVAGITSPTTADSLNFGNGAVGLGAGTVAVSGTVNAGDITFASGSGAIVLSGGTVNLAPVSAITVNNSTDTIDSILSGAGTSLTKLGTGTLVLGGGNSYTGQTILSAGTLRLTNTGAIGASSQLSMATGTTLELRKDDTGGTFTNTRLNPVGNITINADRISSGSGQTLTLGGTVVYAGGSTSTINFTGANGYNVGLNAMYFNAGSASQSFTLNPTTANSVIGAIRVNTNNTNPDGWGAGTANNVGLVLGGSVGTNNTIASITEISGASTQLVITKNTAATWNITGNVDTKQGNGHSISAGTLNMNGGSFIFGLNSATARALTVSGTGILGYNNAGAVQTLGTGAVLTMAGGSIDNSSGAAIATSTTNPNMSWTGDWTFIGSNGANSDLNLGTGLVSIVGAMRQVTVANAATNLTVGGMISGTGGLTKSGAGTLNLSGANTFSGTATRVNSGTLLLSNALALQNSALDTTGAGVVTLSGFTAPTFGGLSGATGNLSGVISNYGTVTGLTLNPQAGISANYGGVISNGTGATTLTKTGTGNQILSGANTYTGITNINAGRLTLGGAENPDVSGPLGKQLANAAGTIVFGGGTLQYSAANNFDYSGRFSTAAGQAINVDTNGQAVTWATDLVSSGGTLAKGGAGTLTLTGANTYSGATTVSAGTLDLGGGTANGSLSSTNLVLAGGTFSYTRTGGNTQAFTGTNVNAGASTVNAAAGSTITLGTLTPAAGGSVNFGTTGTITTPTANNANGILGGWATFGGNNWAVANGAGSAITGFAGTYSFTNDVLVQNSGAGYAGKMISVNSTQTPDAIITPDTLTFNTAGAYTLTLTGTTNTIPGIMVNDVVGNNASLITGGTIRGASNGSLNIIQNNTANTLTIGSIIANNGTSGLSKSGAGTVILTANATYTGTTAISAGTLQLGNGGATGTLSSSSAIVNNGSLVISHSSSQTLAAISGSGSVTYSGALPGTATLLGLSNNNTFSGGFILNSGFVGNMNPGIYGGFGTGLLTINGGGLRGTNTGAATIIPNDVQWNGTLALGRGGGGNPIFTFNGNITLNGSVGTSATGAAEPYSVTFNGNIGEATVGSSLTFGTNSSGHVFTFNGQNTFTGGINANTKAVVVGGSGYLGGGNYTAGITGGTFTYSSSANQTLGGVLSISSLTKNTSNTSTLTLTNSNAYIGNTTIDAGTLDVSGSGAQIYNSASAVTGAIVTVNTGGTLVLATMGSDATTAFSLGNLQSTADKLVLNGGTLRITNETTSRNRGLTIGANGGTIELNSSGYVMSSSGAIPIANNAKLTLSGTGSGTVDRALNGTGVNLTKAGAGTWTLSSAANTYTGATEVNEGSLIVNGNISTSILTTVKSGATLGGSGSVGALTVNAGGFFSPGNSPGIATVNGNYIQNGTLIAEMTGLTPGATGHDQVAVNGTVNLSGALSLAFNTFTPVNGDMLFILLNDDTDAIAGTFAGLGQGSVAATYGGFDWQISYNANNTGVGTGTFGGGNDIALMAVAVPEPGTALLGALGLLALLRRKR